MNSPKDPGHAELFPWWWMCWKMELRRVRKERFKSLGGRWKKGHGARKRKESRNVYPVCIEMRFTIASDQSKRIDSRAISSDTVFSFKFKLS